MGWEAWFTIGLVLFLFVALILEVAPPDMVLLGGSVLLCLVGIIDAKDVVSGFSNEGMLTVAALFVVAAGLRETAALDRLGGRLLGGARTETGALLRLTAQILPFSAFLNNTAVVAMFLPVVSDWCRKNRVSPSKLMIPLSYLAILGGLATLIGTSTNLVVYGLAATQRKTAPAPHAEHELAGMHLFDWAWVGLPLALAGATYLLLIGRRQLPDIEGRLERPGDAAREYVVEMVVKSGCALINQTVESGGLRRLPGLFLIEIVRDGQLIAPVMPTESIFENDQLTFAGVVDTIVDLERIPGLAHATDDAAPDLTEKRRRRYCEAVISGTSPLIGQTIRDANFRALYNAAVVAVHRGSERVEGRIGDIELRVGDTLLLQAGANFSVANRNNTDFYLVSNVDAARPVRHERAWIAIVLLFALIVLLGMGETLGIPAHIAAFTIAGVMMMTHCISTGEARRSLHLDVLLAIAAAFGIGAALNKSGAADAVSGQLAKLVAGHGAFLALLLIFVMTSALTELLSNNAAAVLVFPFAISLADQLDVSRTPFAFAVAYAASCGFATPIGYQTHMMVWGPGGYRFTDFMRVGIPMNLLIAVLGAFLTSIVWKL